MIHNLLSVERQVMIQNLSSVERQSPKSEYWPSAAVARTGT